MYPKIATMYDQNPKRIQLVAHHRHKAGKSVLPALIGLKLLAGLVTTVVWNYLPV